MSKESDFFIYLIERYAESKETTARKVLEQWDSLHLTDFIYDMYGIYHSERLQNAFDDIDGLIAEANAKETKAAKAVKKTNVPPIS